MTPKPNPSRRLWPYLAVPALAVLVATTIYVGDFTAEDVGLGGSSDEGLPSSQADESELADSSLQPDAEELRAAAHEKLESDLTERIDEYLAGIEDENLYVSVALSDSEFDLGYKAEEQHSTASIVKVEILTMLLREYGSPEDFPDWVATDAEKMIRESDNEATTNLLFGVFDDGHAAIREAHEEFGLENTEPYETEQWGLTWSTAADQRTMLETALYDGILDAAQTEYARSLMGDLEEDQSWGVSAAAAEGETVWSKNGWDTRDDLGGEWVVNSIGVIAGDTDNPIELAIMTGGLASEEDGIAVVEDIAKIAREVIDTDPYA
ncbi:serine hydrolase [Glycomyces buryatensis]|uniref:Beta-lactamase class A catalytic domain-containing protein n=1 Tax=Glycomyces buryatensis TaxID=2570927 RepID=A0A4S8QCP8_9ACTN|nr:serine hydrolase [Glycomyces buryatensis]THV40655.1 hypothetical protein FAB82_15470 [Glycomyces buryatensis]